MLSVKSSNLILLRCHTGICKGALIPRRDLGWKLAGLEHGKGPSQLGKLGLILVRGYGMNEISTKKEP